MNNHEHTSATAPAAIRTEDGAALHVGDRAYNYYDRCAGTIGAVDSAGWFDFPQDDGRTAYLDGSRICTIGFAIARGWVAR